MAQPEKLNLWDRIFNRYKKIIHKRGTEQYLPLWNNRLPDYANLIPISRDYIEYLIIDRLTGSEIIKKEYI